MSYDLGFQEPTWASRFRKNSSGDQLGAPGINWEATVASKESNLRSRKPPWSPGKPSLDIRKPMRCLSSYTFGLLDYVWILFKFLSACAST